MIKVDEYYYILRGTRDYRIMRLLIVSEKPEVGKLRQTLESAEHSVDIVLPKKIAGVDQRIYDFVIGEPLIEGACLRNGNIELCAAAYVLRRNKKVIKTTLTEFRIVQYFLEHIGKIVTRDDLMLQCWGRTGGVSRNMIQVYIRRIRGKLGDNVIRTVHGIGYQMDRKER